MFEEFEIVDVLHAIESFRAVLRPVAIVMAVCSWAVVNIKLAGGQTASKLLVFDESADLSQGVSLFTMLWHAAANSMAIICIFCITTLFIVLLYKFKCTTCMIVYMVMSSTLLLGMMGGMMAYDGVEAFHIYISRISFGLLLWNFAVVGIIAVFYNKVPSPVFYSRVLSMQSVH
jgi:presenilin 1